MTDRPILFSGPMVRAILAGQKTQTRRVAKGVVARHTSTGEALANIDSAGPRVRCPYGQPGDRLWVRETFGHFERNDTLKPGDTIYYRADGECLELEPWRPSIHMPRWASRILLQVTGIRVERLQDITRADALAEGIVETRDGYGLPDGSHYHADDPRESYWSLWEAINGPGSVQSNPWVWVVEFKRLVSCAS